MSNVMWMVDKLGLARPQIWNYTCLIFEQFKKTQYVRRVAESCQFNNGSPTFISETWLLCYYTFCPFFLNFIWFSPSNDSSPLDSNLMI